MLLDERLLCDFILALLRKILQGIFLYLENKKGIYFDYLANELYLIIPLLHPVLSIRKLGYLPISDF